MNALTARDIAYIAAFAALTIALGAISIPIGTAGVPIVLQNMGILLAAMLLGWLRGGLSILLFVGVGLVGVPNLAGWKPTLAAIAGPTIGYVVGYIIAAFLVGALAQMLSAKIGKNRPTIFTIGLFSAGIIGVIVIYFCGALGLMYRVGLDFPAALATNIAFIVGDLVKIAAAAAIAAAVHRALPDLLPTTS